MAYRSQARLNTRRKLQRLLGSCNYYRQLVPKFSQIASELYKLCGENKPFKITQIHEKAIADLKKALCKAIEISLPFQDGKWKLNTDASLSGSAAVLSHINTITGENRIIEVVSGSWTEAQKRWSIAALELVSAARAMLTFKRWIQYTKFDLHIDNLAAYHILKHPEKVIIAKKAAPIARALTIMAEYTFNPMFIKGENISHALTDTLSRNTDYVVKDIRAKNLLQPYHSLNVINDTALILPYMVTDRQVIEMVENAQRKMEDKGELVRHKHKLGYKIKDGIHCIYDKPISPESITKSLIIAHHIHGAPKQTTCLIKQRPIYVQNLRQRCIEEALACETCTINAQKINKEKNLQSGLHPERGIAPFKALSADFNVLHELRPLKRQILVILDLFSDHMTLELCHMDAKSTASKFIMFCLDKGVQNATLRVDNGFRSKELMSALKLFNIRVRFSVAYNSRSNARCERKNRSINNYLRMNGEKINWRSTEDVQLHLKICEYLINSKIDTKTELSPNMIVKPHMLINNPERYEILMPKSTDDYILKIAQVIRHAYSINQEKRSTSEKTSKFNINDKVRLKNSHKFGNKLQPGFGKIPWKIIEMRPECQTYKIVRLDTQNDPVPIETLAHARRLTKVKSDENNFEKLLKTFELAPNFEKFVQEISKL